MSKQLPEPADFTYDLSLPGLKTLQNARLRNTKSTNSRNNDISSSNLKADLFHNHSVMLPNQTYNKIELMSKNQITSSYINLLPYSSSEKELKTVKLNRPKLKKIVFSNKNEVMYVNEQYEEVEITKENEFRYVNYKT